MSGIDPAIVAAVEEARSRVRESPRSAEAWGKLGMVLVVHDFRAQANFCLAQAEQLDPNDLRWPYYQALGALIVADAEGGLPKLERAVALCGDDFDAPRVRLAELLLSQNQLDEAEKHFRRLLEHNAHHPRAQLGLARIFAQRGEPGASLVPLSFAQKDSRTRKTACQLLAQIHQQLGNPAAAEEARQQAASLLDDPSWPDPLNDQATDLCTGKKVWIKRARRFADLGRDADALALLQRTVNEYPEADDAWLQLGKLLLRQKKPAAAEQALLRATELAPGSHESVFYLGAALVVQGNLPAATTCFRRATELKSDFAPAYYNLGNALADVGNSAGAIGAYRMAVRYEPQMVDAHLSLATLLAGSGQLPEAIVHAHHAQKLRPADPRAAKLMERVLVKLFFGFRFR